MAEINTNNSANKNQDFFGGNAVLDESIDLDALIASAKAPETVKEEKKVVSPLEAAMNAPHENGLVITKEEYEKGLEQGPKENMAMTTERVEEMENKVSELDDTMKKRKAVIVIKQAMTQTDYVEMMNEIHSVHFDENDKAYFDYKDTNGNPVTPRFVRIRTDNDITFEEESKYTKLASDEEKAEVLANNENVNTNNEKNTIDKPSDELAVKKDNIIKILIDKTGFGTDFHFTDDEKKKIFDAQEIRLTEVSKLDIESIKAKKSDISFQDSIKAYQMSNSKTTICFPASGFRAQMKGLTYGEMGDISLSMDNVTVDQYYKRLSIIYNKMFNINVGPFKSFEDFLKGFAYVDIPMALYGLYVATQPEIQQIQLRCGNNECDKTFNWEFATRSVLKLDNCSMEFLEKMEELATAPASEYDNIHKNAAVNNSKYIKLPHSGFIVEMGIISAYEFLYNFIPVLDEDTFKNAFGDDPNQVYMNNILLLSAIRSIRIPNADGSYTICEGYKEILEAIYNISPEEIQIIGALTSKFSSEYQSAFSFNNVVCPHCGNVTKDLEITMDDLVFQTYQRLMSTEIDVTNIQGF